MFLHRFLVCAVLLGGTVVAAQHKAASPGRASSSVLVSSASASHTAGGFSTDPPGGAATHSNPYSVITGIVLDAIRQNQIPGAVVEVGRGGRVVYRRAFGYRALVPHRERMTTGTIFDCASLTKPVATATSILQLVEQGRIRLNDPVASYLPAFGQNGKAAITVRELLTHYSGLPPDLNVNLPWHGYEEGIERAFAVMPMAPPDAQFRYSDINYVVLGELVRKISNQRLDDYSLRHVFRPLGMAHTRFNPPRSWRPRIAPTERDPETGEMLRGVPQDPTARYMEGVSGDAGMFSSADDLSRFARMMLNGGILEGARVLSRATVVKMTTPQTPFNNPDVRGLGWDLDTPFSTNRGVLLPVGSYGHTGYTGTSLWIDPYSRTWIVILSNVHHPSGRPPAIELRNKIATAVGAIVANAHGSTAPPQLETQLERITGYNEVNASVHRPLARNGDVLTGLDILKARNFDLLQQKRVGIITNQTGIDREGNRDLDDMIAAHVHVTAAFSPEHGWNGVLDQPHIGNSVDRATGVPVFSAYGDTVAAQHLPAAGLNLVDVLVFDVQDIGVRFYTYETTLAYSLESAARAHKPIFVLDRPSMLDGIHVEGPPLAPSEKSFVGYYPGMPVRNGMTTGELATMFNDTLHLGADLQVVRLAGWSRGDYYDSTGLPWVNPSPNLRDLLETIVYPGVALVEGTNVSVGRGTDRPFEIVGAPWINRLQFAGYLNAQRIPGVRFIPTSFVPVSSRYARQVCNGVNILPTDRTVLDPIQLGLEIASALARLYPSQWNSSEMHMLAGSQQIVDAIRRGDDPAVIMESYQPALRQFELLRSHYLLYGPDAESAARWRAGARAGGRGR
jgi:uncharacterized protein YbbC (DUF1343 family)/CubicO group peptidase (beta-lactamase class C family)